MSSAYLYSVVYALIFVVGLAVSIWAYRVGRRPGYLLIAAYFLYASCNMIYNFMIAPRIDAARFESWVTRRPPPTEEEKAFQEELEALLKRDPRPSYDYNTFRLPTGINQLSNAVMVLGIWMVGRREHRKGVEPNDEGQPSIGRAASSDET